METLVAARMEEALERIPCQHVQHHLPSAGSQRVLQEMSLSCWLQRPMTPLENTPAPHILESIDHSSSDRWLSRWSLS